MWAEKVMEWEGRTRRGQPLNCFFVFTGSLQL